MRKRLITPTQGAVRSRGEDWLDVERAAIVEITSEDKNFPVESAFASGETQGWRAAMAGARTIRLIFDQPQRLKQISLVFERKKLRGRKNSSYAGLPMAGPPFEKLCANSGTLAHLRQCARSRNIKSRFQTSAYLN